MTDPKLEQLKRNLKYIDNDEPEVQRLNQLLNQNVDLNLQEDSPGRYNLVFRKDEKWIPYHRVRDPFSEFKNKLEQNHSSDIILGIGTGYGYQFTQSVETMKKARSVILAEPSYEALFILLTSVELSRVFGDNLKLVYCPEVEVLQRYIEKQLNRYHKTDLQICALDSVETLFPGYMNDVIQHVKTVWDRHVIYLASQQEQNEEILANTLINSLSLPQCHNLLPDTAGERPLVISGSGPSLSAHLTLLKTARDRFMLMAVGSALQILIDNGITPDLVVISDPQQVNKLHFPEGEYHINLIADITVEPEIVEKFKGRKTLVNIGHNLPSILFKADDLLRIDNWGTVTTTGISLARYLKFKKIALIGTEYSFSSGDQHATGYAIKTSGSDKQGYRVTDVLKRNVFTTEIFASYAAYTDGLIRHMAAKDIQLFNCSDGGLIEAAPPVSLRHFLKDHCQDNELSRELEAFQPASFPDNLGFLLSEKLALFENDARKQLDRLKKNELQVRELSTIHLFAALEGVFWKQLQMMEEHELNENREELNSLADELLLKLSSMIKTAKEVLH